jgi:hypothetical protein
MNSKKIMLFNSIGLVILAIVVYFIDWNNSNIWIPISSIFIILSINILLIRSVFISIDERFNKLEK